MTNTTFNPAMDRRPLIPPTADEREGPFSATTQSTGTHSTFRNRIIQGEVQDENAFVLGGVAGHAGLFSNAEDIARFAHAMLQRRKPDSARGNGGTLYSPSRRILPGLLVPSDGTHLPVLHNPGNILVRNHSGTSAIPALRLWIDPDRQLSVTLLTNRTWPDCSNQAIKQVRPKFHDAVVEALR